MRLNSQRMPFLAASGATLLVYWFSLPPHLTPGMSGAYATGAAFAGISHPTGDPAWTLYAWLFSHLIPVGNLAWRASLASACAASIACGLIASLVAQSGGWILGSQSRFARLPPTEENWLRTVAGAVAGIAFGVTPGCWRKALTPEPHTFGIMLFCLTLACLARWFPNPDRRRWLLAAVFAYGVALVSSPHLFAAAFGLVLVVLMGDRALGRDLLGFSAILLLGGVGWELFGSVPTLLSNLTQSYAMWGVYLFVGFVAALVAAGATVHSRQLGTQWHWGAALLLALFSCVSLYLFLPISSMTNPPMNWSYGREVEGFLALIGRAQYEQIDPGFEFGTFGVQMTKFGPRILFDFGLLFLIPAGLTVALIRRWKGLAGRWMGGILLLAVTMFLLLLGCLSPPPDAAYRDGLLPFFAGFHVLLAVLSGYGLLIVGTVLGRPGVKREAGGS